MASIRSAAASSTCSQLSMTSSRILPSSAVATDSLMLLPGCWVIPRVAATASGTAAGSPTASKLEKRDAVWELISQAGQRLRWPDWFCRHRPPGQCDEPMRSSAAATASSSASRPIRLPGAGRRLPGVVSRVRNGGKSLRRPDVRTWKIPIALGRSRKRRGPKSSKSTPREQHPPWNRRARSDHRGRRP